MPSGAKKRKAAKKKQGGHSNHHSKPSPASHGDEDVKHQEDKESDADHHGHHNLLTEGEEEEIEKQRSQELKIGTGDKQQIEVEENVKVEREFKIEGDSDKNETHSRAAMRKLDDGTSGSSSSESSEDETHSQAAADIAPVVDSMKTDDSLSVKSSEAIQSEALEPSSVDCALKENGAEKPSSVEDKTGTSMASVNAAVDKREEEIVQSLENNATDTNECVIQENDDKLALLHNAPQSIGAEDSGVTEPLLVPSQRPVEKTSWKSCCGLFDVFSGSSS